MGVWIFDAQPLVWISGIHIRAGFSMYPVMQQRDSAAVLLPNGTNLKWSSTFHATPNRRKK